MSWWFQNMHFIGSLFRSIVAYQDDKLVALSSVGLFCSKFLLCDKVGLSALEVWIRLVLVILKFLVNLVYDFLVLVFVIGYCRGLDVAKGVKVSWVFLKERNLVWGLIILFLFMEIFITISKYYNNIFIL